MLFQNYKKFQNKVLLPLLLLIFSLEIMSLPINKHYFKITDDYILSLLAKYLLNKNKNPYNCHEK